MLNENCEDLPQTAWLNEVLEVHCFWDDGTSKSYNPHCTCTTCGMPHFDGVCRLLPVRNEHGLTDECTMIESVYHHVSSNCACGVLLVCSIWVWRVPCRMISGQLYRFLLFLLAFRECCCPLDDQYVFHQLLLLACGLQELFKGFPTKSSALETLRKGATEASIRRWEPNWAAHAHSIFDWWDSICIIYNPSINILHIKCYILEGDNS